MPPKLEGAEVWPAEVWPAEVWPAEMQQGAFRGPVRRAAAGCRERLVEAVCRERPGSAEIRPAEVQEVGVRPAGAPTDETPTDEAPTSAGTGLEPVGILLGAVKAVDPRVAGSGPALRMSGCRAHREAARRGEGQVVSPREPSVRWVAGAAGPGAAPWLGATARLCAWRKNTAPNHPGQGRPLRRRRPQVPRIQPDRRRWSRSRSSLALGSCGSCVRRKCPSRRQSGRGSTS